MLRNQDVDVKSFNISSMQIQKTIASTNNSIVLLAKWQDTPLIIKKIFKANKRAAKQEYAVLNKLDSPYVVKLFGDLQKDSRFYYITMEYISGLNLYDFLRQATSPKFEDKYQIFNDIIYGVDYIHAKHIIHRDLKTQNILIDHAGHAKIIDFGFSLEVPSNTYQQNTICGTPLYMAPELFASMSESQIYDAHSVISNAIDIWALGLILLEIYTEKNPFYYVTKPSELKYAIKNANENDLIPSDCPTYFANLIFLCLKKDPKKRASAETIRYALEHPKVLLEQEPAEVTYTFRLFKPESKKIPTTKHTSGVVRP